MYFQPESYGVQLTLLVVSALCWGSWANTMKLTPGWRFQSFYIDYVWGLFAATLAWGALFDHSFFQHLTSSSGAAIWLAILSGILFNAANQLLVAAIDLAGMAVAFPVGIGLALVLGVILSYVQAPAGNALLLFAGVFLVVVAIVLDSLAYRLRESGAASVSRTGLLLALVSGVMMGLFYPVLSRGIALHPGFGPFFVTPYFAAGIAICAIPMNWWLMRKPFKGEPVNISNYTAAPLRWHMWGAIGGAIWCTGLVFNLIGSRATLVGAAVSYAIGQGATMVSAVWGVFVWKEFRGAPAISRTMIGWMFLAFTVGLLMIALAPTLR